MRSQTALTLGLSLALLGAFSAQAMQRHGGGQRGSTAGTGRGTMMQDMQRDRDTMRDQDMMRDRDMTRDRTPIYGSQLMTQAERDAYRTHMRSLKTQQERDAFRMQHHTEMQQRAAQRGMTLPDTPPANRGGMNMGQGMGPAKGSGVQQQTRQDQRNQRQDQQLREREETREQERGGGR